MNAHFLLESSVRIVLISVLFACLPGVGNLALAQSENLPDIQVWGVFQPRLSYGASDDSTSNTNRAGYGIRRARFRVEVGLKNKIGVRYDADFASGTFQSVDLFAFLKVSSKVRVRLGIMPSAQPRAHIFTPIPLIDGFDRAAIAEQWAAATLGGGGRDFGIDFQYQTPIWTAVAFLHNGDGSFSRNRGNYAQTISSESATRGVDQTSLATSLYIAHRIPALQGVEIGGYLSHNPSRNPNTEGSDGMGREYFSYAGHLYYGAVPGSQPVRAKLDVIGINFDGQESVDRLGMSILGAVLLNPYTELFARYENVQKDTRLSGIDFVSAGISFSLSKFSGGSFEQQRATLGYSTVETAAGSREHLIVFQWQLVL